MQEFRPNSDTQEEARKRIVTTAKSSEALFKAMERNRVQMEELDYRETYRKKLGRNDLCPCGSGKKFKKCHIDNVTELNELLAEQEQENA